MDAVGGAVAMDTSSGTRIRFEIPIPVTDVRHSTNRAIKP
jgi:hypothetical protein